MLPLYARQLRTDITAKAGDWVIHWSDRDTVLPHTEANARAIKAVNTALDALPQLNGDDQAIAQTTITELKAKVAELENRLHHKRQARVEQKNSRRSLSKSQSAFARFNGEPLGVKSVIILDKVAALGPNTVTKDVVSALPDVDPATISACFSRFNTQGLITRTSMPAGPGYFMTITNEGRKFLQEHAERAHAIFRNEVASRATIPVRGVENLLSRLG